MGLMNEGAARDGIVRRTALGGLVGGLAGTLAGSVAAGPSRAGPGAPAVRIDPARLAGLLEFVDGVMAEQLAGREVAGAVVTAVHAGRVLFARGYGYADVDKLRPVDARRTLFRPGSVSKLITWTGLMQQVEAGRVDLAADVGRYLDFQIPDAGYKPIRVGDLFTHTAGFGDQSDITAASLETLTPFRDWMKSHIAMRVRPPGVESQYSNYGAALAGYIVERVSGLAFADYVEARIFAPLRMTDTTFKEPLTGPRATRIAEGYRVEGGRLVKKPFELFSQIMPAGSASTTAPDMARFMLAFLNGGALDGARILKPQSVQFLEADGFKNAPRLPGFAHGFMVVREAGPRIVGHGGNTADQHSFLFLAPEAGFGFFVSETGGPLSYVGRTELMQAVIGRVFPVPRAPRWTGEGTPPPMGAYRSNRRDYGRPVEALHDLKVSSAGPHAVMTEQDGQKLYFEEIAPRLFEEVTGARDGGPFERLEFYGPPEDPKLSFSSQPHVLYRLVQA